MASAHKKRSVKRADDDAPAATPHRYCTAAEPDVHPHAPDELKSVITTAIDTYVAPMRFNPDNPLEY